MKKFLISALAAVALFGTANAADFEVSETSKVAFSVKHLKLLTVDGSFDKFSGKISYDAGKLSALEGSVDVASINTQNGKRDDHLRANDIFDAAKYSTMTFKMSEFKDGKIIGTLNVKGKDHQVALDAKISENAGKPVIAATGVVKRSELGLVWENSLKDSAASDEVTIYLELSAK